MRSSHSNTKYFKKINENICPYKHTQTNIEALFIAAPNSKYNAHQHTVVYSSNS